MTPGRRFEAGVEAMLSAAYASNAHGAIGQLPGRRSSEFDATPTPSTDADTRDELSELADADQSNAGTPAYQLASRLGLTPLECHFIWALAAHATDRRLAEIGRQQFGSSTQVGLSIAQFGTWRNLAPAAEYALQDLFATTHPIRRFGLAMPYISDGTGVSAPWRINQSVVDFLRGVQTSSLELAGLGGLLTIDSSRLHYSPAQKQIIQKLTEWVRLSVTGNTKVTIVLEGQRGSGRGTAFAHAAPTERVFAVDYERVSSDQAVATLAAQLREAAFSFAFPILRNFDEFWQRITTDAGLQPIAFAIASLLDQVAGPLLITTCSAKLDLSLPSRAHARLRWPVPDAEARQQLWRDAVGTSVEHNDIVLLAQRYQLGPGGIVAAARSATLRGTAGIHTLTFAQLVSGVQSTITEQLSGLATRVEVTQDWSNLVVSPETSDDIVGLLARVQFSHAVLDGWNFRRKLARGAGVAALFSGPPGTGKTMVAGLIARELELELYQVDLSNIVSKWVGETEKQLSKLFDAAEAGHALLLFDEADSLFAKRSAEVKSATDRYANLEVNYLLQRVESFGGFVILTTNLDTSIDPALRRRLAAHIVFGPPEVAERAKLWQEMLNTGAPLATDINWNQLAEDFSDMTGANIRNAAIASAFLAAEEDTTIAVRHILRAARSEYRSMGRVLGRISNG